METEEQYLATYKGAWASSPYPPIFVTTDAVVHHYGNILMIQRGRHPGMGKWALPGGFVNENELLYDSCIRELKEETNLDVLPVVLRNSLQGIHVWDDVLRSKRGRTITHAYYFDLKIGYLPHIEAMDDAADAQWIPLYRLKELDIYEDHLDIIMKEWKYESHT